MTLDFTATTGRHRLHTLRPSPALRHRAFAAQLGGVRRFEARTSPVERVLRRLDHSVVRQASVTLNLAPRFVEATSPMRSMAAAVVQRILRIEHVRTIERLVERQRSFATRVLEYRDAPAATAGSAELRTLVRERIERHTAFPRPAMTVVHRRDSAAPGPASAQRSDVTSRAITKELRPYEAARIADRPVFTLPAQELSRVTDHVIGELDRRVLSYRERQGQV